MLKVLEIKFKWLPLYSGSGMNPTHRGGSRLKNKDYDNKIY